MKKTYAILVLLILAGAFSGNILAEEYNDPFVPNYIKISDATKDDKKDEELAEVEVKEEENKKEDSKEEEDKDKEDKEDKDKDKDKKEEKKEESTEYTVVPGDCLSAIAGRFLGDMGRWPELVEANKDKYPSLESNPNLIYAGWQLTVPGADSKVIASANSSSGSSGSGSNTASGGKVAPTGEAIDSSGFGSVSPCTPMPSWVSSEFGYRTHPVTGQKQSFHNAVDLPVPTGTRLNALANGTVIAVGFESGGGNYCTIKYDNGMESFYCHLQSSTVKVGQRVECGQQVAISDNTGAYTTGAHLHCGIKKDGQYVNPRDYLKLP